MSQVVIMIMKKKYLIILTHLLIMKEKNKMNKF